MSKNVADILWQKACHDYNAAERLVDVDPEVVGDPAFGFLLQQSVEKAIKSRIEQKNLAYKKVHDIALLLEILSKKMEIPEAFSDLFGLSSYASTERYESPFSPNRLDRRRLLGRVRAFLEFLECEGGS